MGCAGSVDTAAARSVRTDCLNRGCHGELVHMRRRDSSAFGESSTVNYDFYASRNGQVIDRRLYERLMVDIGVKLNRRPCP